MDRIKTLLGGGKTLLTAAARDVVHNVAPNLGRALDSPLGQVAQREIAKKLLGDPGANPQELSRTLEDADAAVVRGLTDAQAELMEAFQQAGVDLARIEAEDRANARAAHADDPTPARLTYMAFAALCAAFSVLLFYPPGDTATLSILNMVIGALIVLCKDGFGYFVGSSKGSKDKTALMAAGGK